MSGRGGTVVLRPDVLEDAHVSAAALDEAIVKAREDPPRAAQHGGVSHAPEIHGRTAIVVGDGLATGAPMQAAITSLRRLAPARSSPPVRSARETPVRISAARSTR